MEAEPGTVWDTEKFVGLVEGSVVLDEGFWGSVDLGGRQKDGLDWVDVADETEEG